MTEAQRERFSEAINRLAGDEETLAMLASIAAEDAPGLLDLMRRHLHDGDLAAYAKSAHAMKGLLSTFETGDPVSEIQPAIDTAKQGDQQSTVACHDRIEGPIKDLIAEVQALVG